MATFADNTGKWEQLTNADTKLSMTEFLTKYPEIVDAVTITNVEFYAEHILWEGNLNGRIFDVTQDTVDHSDYAHDVHHDTYGNRSANEVSRWE